MSKVLLIKDDKLGEGELGAMMIGGFLQAIQMQDQNLLPKAILLLNRGVLLACKLENYQKSLEELQKLQALGVDICLCQTCVDYFNLQDCIGVGRIDQAPHISKILLSHEVLSL